MRPSPWDPAQGSWDAVRGPLGPGIFHHQQPPSAFSPPAHMARTCSQGLAGSPCSWLQAEARPHSLDVRESWAWARFSRQVRPTLHLGFLVWTTARVPVSQGVWRALACCFPNSGPGCPVSGSRPGASCGGTKAASGRQVGGGSHTHWCAP